MRRKTLEEYIEIIYVLERKEGRARTVSIALEMGVKPPTVTEMLHKLQKDGIVDYETYIGAKLTPSGLYKAKELMRKHKVIADFIEIIGVDRELAEIDACQLEHHVSSKTVAQLKKFVDFVRDAPRDPKWIEHFRLYCDRGERIACDLCPLVVPREVDRPKRERRKGKRGRRARAD